MGDLGINATTHIVEDLKAQVAEKKIKDPQECKQLLMDSIKSQMAVGETAYESSTASLWSLSSVSTVWARPHLWASWQAS